MATLDGKPNAVEWKVAQSTDNLSVRQIECLILISRGFNLEEASRSMAISERTAKRYLDCAKARLGARSNAHAVMRAVSLGIISPES